MYEYAKWTVKIIIMSSYQSKENESPRFLTGEGAAPPEQVDGVRHFKKLIGSLEAGGISEQQTARHELGSGFSSGIFDLEKMNHELREVFGKK